MVTDDPGTPGAGNWEINISAIRTSDPDHRFLQVPYFDFNYGWGERLQLKFETGWSFQSDRNSAGPMQLGLKWRFLDQETAGVSVSTFPAFGCRDPFMRADEQLNPARSRFRLPIEVSKEMGQWAVNPEAGYEHSTREPDSWFLGLVGSYQPKKDFELLGELRTRTEFNGGGFESLYSLGTRYPFTPSVLLLFSIARTFTQLEGDAAQLTVYLGVQVKI